MQVVKLFVSFFNHICFDTKASANQLFLKLHTQNLSLQNTSEGLLAVCSAL